MGHKVQGKSMGRANPDNQADMPNKSDSHVPDPRECGRTSFQSSTFQSQVADHEINRPPPEHLPFRGKANERKMR